MVPGGVLGPAGDLPRALGGVRPEADAVGVRELERDRRALRPSSGQEGDGLLDEMAKPDHRGHDRGEPCGHGDRHRRDGAADEGPGQGTEHEGEQGPGSENQPGDLVGLARGATLVGHNICFDWGFILRALHAHDLDWSGNGRYLDTMALAPWAGAGLADRRLLTMAEHLGIPTDGAHRALVDAGMCRSVFLRLAPPRLAPLEEWLPDAVLRRSPVASGSDWRPSRVRSAWLGWRRALRRVVTSA